MKTSVNAVLKATVVASLFMLPGLACLPQDDAANPDANGPSSETNEAVSALTIGSPAPPLDIQYWVQDGNGKFPKVSEFEQGKVYVVEFWATWCGPCIASMPHLAETQQKYADRGVQLISISDERLEKVEAFLERDFRDADKSDPDSPQTYGDLTSVYCLTTDPDRSNHAAYMEAAGENGIPTAFIVGKDGMIEWIGHPMEMDEPLEKVVTGEWVREEYVAERQKQVELQQKMMAMQDTMSKVFSMTSAGKYDEALAKIDELMAEAKDTPQLKSMLATTKLGIVLEGKPEQISDILKQSLDLAGDDVETLNNITWTYYEYAADADEIDKEQLALATTYAEKMIELAPENGPCIDTLAHLVYLQGDLDRAIELQTKAVENAGGMEAELTKFLEQLKEEKKSSEDKSE